MTKFRLFLDILIKRQIHLLIVGLWVTVAMLFHRRPDSLSLPQFWCEDGELFFLQSYHMGFVSFFHQYMGYLHLFPRLVSISAEYCVPRLYIPLYYNLLSFIAFLLLAIYIWWRGAENKWTALWMVLCLTMIPIRNEIYMTITDQQWSLALGLLIPLANPAKQKYWIWADTFLILLAGLSSIFVLVFLPLILFSYFISRAEIKREPIKKLPFLAYGFAIFMTGLTFALYHVERSQGKTIFWEVIKGLLKLYYQQFVHLTGSVSWTNTDSLGVVALVGSIFAFLTLFVWCLSMKKAKNEREYAAFIFISASLLAFAAVIYGFRKNLAMVHPFAFATFGPRYFFIPLVTFFWGCFYLFTRSKTFMSIVSTVFIGLFCFRSHIYPSDKFPDMHWERYVSKFEQNKPFVIPINPPGRGWKIEIDPGDHRNYTKYFKKMVD
jgi:hypothetical protein